MRFLRPLSASALLLLAVTPLAAQTSYQFDVRYDNGVLALAPGSDPMIGTTLFPGDDFTWRLSIDGPGFWEAATTDLYYFLPAFGVVESGSRRGSFQLQMLLDQSFALGLSSSGQENRFVHLGANVIFMPAGLRWDEMVFHYTLEAARSGHDPDDPNAPIVGTTFSSLFRFGSLPPEQDPNIVFIADDPPSEVVPEPATLTLLASGLVGLAGARRRRGQSPRPDGPRLGSMI